MAFHKELPEQYQSLRLSTARSTGVDKKKKKKKKTEKKKKKKKKKLFLSVLRVFVLYTDNYI